MGRSLRPGGLVDPFANLITWLAQAAGSIVYGLVIALAVTHWRGLWAIGLGALIGLALYGLNLLAFHLATGLEWSRGEWPVVVDHLVFGFFAAGLYKGLARRWVVGSEQ
jgi:hypothetical protein